MFDIILTEAPWLDTMANRAAVFSTVCGNLKEHFSPLKKKI